MKKLKSYKYYNLSDLVAWLKEINSTWGENFQKYCQSYMYSDYSFDTIFLSQIREDKEEEGGEENHKEITIDLLEFLEKHFGDEIVICFSF